MAKHSSFPKIISKTARTKPIILIPMNNLSNDWEEGGRKGGRRAKGLGSLHFSPLLPIRLGIAIDCYYVSTSANHTHPILLPRRPFIPSVTPPSRALFSLFARHPSHLTQSAGIIKASISSSPSTVQKMTKKSTSGSDTTELLFKLVWLGAIIYGIGYFLYYAYEIRLQAIKEFGPVIHEFDPYFNWRATQVRLCHDFMTAKHEE